MTNTGFSPQTQTGLSSRPIKNIVIKPLIKNEKIQSRGVIWQRTGNTL